MRGPSPHRVLFSILAFHLGGVMAKRTVSAKELAGDIKAGVSYESLVAKYQVSETNLDGLLQKLLAAGLIAAGEIPVKLVKQHEPPVDSSGQEKEETARHNNARMRFDNLDPKFITIGVAAVLSLVLIVVVGLIWRASHGTPRPAVATSQVLPTEAPDPLYEECRALNRDRCRNHRKQRRGNREAQARGEKSYNASEGVLGDEMQRIMVKMGDLGCFKNYPQLNDDFRERCY